MMRGKPLAFLVLLLALIGVIPAASADSTKDGVAQPDSTKTDLTARLEEIYALRARWLLTGESPPPIESDYLLRLKPAQWALHHEQGKIRYMRQWAENRGVRFVEAKPTIWAKYLSGNESRARFYVAQSLQLGYTYPGEETVNRFGVGTRHIIELRRSGDRWLIGMEWYTDPLGDDTETPDVTPAMAGGSLLPAQAGVGRSWAPAVPASRRSYDREGAVRYADQFCGLAWGCGNENRYNSKYRDYSGVGGDCTNFVSQALREGGKLNIPNFTRVDALAYHLLHTGRATLVAKEPFQKLWARVRSHPGGFQGLLKQGDLVAYQEKGKLEHFAMITGFDTRGYPLVNSHTADRFHVPFDLGWDRKTVYWLLKMRD